MRRCTLCQCDRSVAVWLVSMPRQRTGCVCAVYRRCTPLHVYLRVPCQQFYVTRVLCCVVLMFSFYDTTGAVLRTAGVPKIAVHGAEHAVEGLPCKFGLNLYVRVTRVRAACVPVNGRVGCGVASSFPVAIPGIRYACVHVFPPSGSSLVGMRVTGQRCRRSCPRLGPTQRCPLMPRR